MIDRATILKHELLKAVNSKRLLCCGINYDINNPNINKMTQTEFLLDMLEYYSANPSVRRCTKAIKGQAECCTYSPISADKVGKSEGCAIGRHLDAKLAEQLDVDGGSVGNGIFHYLPDNLKALGEEFLSWIQDLHDFKEHWAAKGLSDTGKGKLRTIIRSFELNRTDFDKFLN